MTEHKPLLQTLVHGIALAVLIGWVLYVARTVLVPVAYSALLVHVVLGMARQMARIPRLGPRLPAALRYVVSAAVILAAVWGLMLVVLASVAEITDNAALYDHPRLARSSARQLGSASRPSPRGLSCGNCYSSGSA
jgi:predicted PurR-regulated permease PerM